MNYDKISFNNCFFRYSTYKRSLNNIFKFPKRCDKFLKQKEKKDLVELRETSISKKSNNVKESIKVEPLKSNETKEEKEQ